MLTELADGVHELGGGEVEKLSADVRVRLLASASAAVIFEKEVDDGGNSRVQSSQDKNCVFHWRSTEGGVGNKKTS